MARETDCVWYGLNLIAPLNTKQQEQNSLSNNTPGFSVLAPKVGREDKYSKGNKFNPSRRGQTNMMSVAFHNAKRSSNDNAVAVTSR
jgi:hypothetical protein